MTFIVEIEYQNFTIIYTEEIILYVLIFLQENILTASKTEYNHTGIKSIHVVVPIECEYWTTGSSR